MLQRLKLLLPLLMLVSCASGPAGDSTGDYRPGEPEPDDSADAGLGGMGKFKHTDAEARAFVRRFESLSVGLVNYIDPSRTELITREFSAETIVFQLDNTGDKGPLYEAAAARADQLLDEYGWSVAELTNEYSPEGHIALVKLESIGIPAGAKTGDLIPVRVTLLGNATDIRSGYVRKTPLRNKLGRTVAMLKQGYLPMAPEKAVTDEQKEESKLVERRETAGQPTFILRAGVQLVARVGSDELTADQIIMPLTREVKGEFVRTLSAEFVPQVLPQIEQGMKEAGFPCTAKHEGNNLVVTPLGVREQSLRQVFERLQTLRVQIVPRNNVVVIFDDAVVRVAIYGPAQHRMLIRDVALTVDPFTRNKPDVVPVALRFRVSCRVLTRAEAGKSGRFGIPDSDERRRGVKPDGSPGRVSLTWSRWSKEDDIEDEGTDELPSADISEVLRFLWTKGMNPPEALGFVLEAHDSLALPCELGLNWRKVDVQKMREEMERDENERNK